MTKYQKAIKVRKTCDSRLTCKGCIYANNCLVTNYFLSPPSYENIKVIAEAIHEEKWDVK